MAARTKRVKVDGNWREKIRISMLLNRLEDHAFGKVDLSPTQIKAIEVLLKKSLPDLSAIEHTGQGGGPMIVRLDDADIRA